MPQYVTVMEIFSADRAREGFRCVLLHVIVKGFVVAHDVCVARFAVVDFDVRYYVLKYSYYLESGKKLRGVLDVLETNIGYCFFLYEQQHYSFRVDYVTIPVRNE